ncbi:PIN domain-containing protein [candidate division KSB1 bacterium]|nr:PIN domain-containing protein [candidate division KSB1 bacterium]
MKVHVDINVFMDVLTQRAGWAESVAALKSLKPRGISGFTSALTMAIIYFQRLRKFGEMQARTDAKFITRDFEITPLSRQIIFEALNSPLPDFEDNIQFFSAKAMQVDYLITRNKKHFAQQEIPVVTPEEFLHLIGILK